MSPGATVSVIASDKKSGARPSRYRIRARRLSLGDDLLIERSSGTLAFRVDAKLFRQRGAFALEDPSGHELYRAEETESGARHTMAIRRRGRVVATVTKTLEGMSYRYDVQLPGNSAPSAVGNFLGRVFAFIQDGETIASVSRSLLRVSHRFELQIAPGQNDALIVAAIVCIDWMGQG